MIYFIIPIFNEEKNIPSLANELLNFTFEEEYFFIFSDDGSSDNTINCLKTVFPQNRLRILGDGLNRGPGYAFDSAFEWVLQNSKNQEDIIITMEADCTSDLKILPNMIAINKLGFDLVLASVYSQGGGFDSTNLFRKSLSYIANLLFRFLFKTQVQTISSFYRVYNVSLIKKIKASNDKIISEYGFICMLEILLKSIICRANIIEVPMILNSSKRKGKSKMKILKTTFEYFRFFFKYQKIKSNKF